MAKPYTHALSSAKKFGGEANDYLKFHEWMDQTKAVCSDARHRAILHSSFGIFLGEQFFGATFENSTGRIISTRNILEQHCMEDFGFIPSMMDFILCMKYEPWMNGIGTPPSHPKNCVSREEINQSLGQLEKINGETINRPNNNSRSGATEAHK